MEEDEPPMEEDEGEVKVIMDSKRGF